MAANAQPSSSSPPSSSRETKSPAAEDHNPRRLPDDVIDLILSFLPLKNAFSSGLISKRFSKSWKFCRDLTFNIDYRTLINGDGDGNPREEMFKLVQFVMDEHQSPEISRLMIIIDPTGKEGQVCNWIFKAVSKGVEELHLDFSAGVRPFFFPSNAMLLDEDNARKLHTLRVCYCDLYSLTALVAFGHLKTLSLDDVLVPRFFVESVFRNCLNLESYDMYECQGLEDDDGYLVIEAADLAKFKSFRVKNCSYLRRIYLNTPTLEVFHYDGEICRIDFANELTKIQKVIIHFNPCRSICLFPGMDDVMKYIKRTKYLSVSSPILEVYIFIYLFINH